MVNRECCHVAESTQITLIQCRCELYLLRSASVNCRPFWVVSGLKVWEGLLFWIQSNFVVKLDHRIYADMWAITSTDSFGYGLATLYSCAFTDFGNTANGSLNIATHNAKTFWAVPSIECAIRDLSCPMNLYYLLSQQWHCELSWHRHDFGASTCLIRCDYYQRNVQYTSNKILLYW